MKLLEFFIDIEVRTRKAMKGLRDTERQSKRTGKSLGGLGLLAGKAGKGFDKAGASLLTMAGRMLPVVSAGVVIGETFNRTLKVAQTWEEGMVSVAKTTGLAGAELAGLKEDLQDLTTDRSLNVTAADLLELATTAGQLGIEGSDQINKFVKSLAQLESASDGRVSGEEGAQALINILRGSDDAIENADRLGSALTVMGNTAATNEGAIIGVAREVGNAAAIYETTAASVIGLSTSFAENKIQAEVARTTFSKTLADISLAVSKGGAEFDKFGDILGMTREQVKDLMDRDAIEVFRRFVSGLNDAKNEGRDLNVIMEDLNISDIRRTDSLKKLSTETDLMTQRIKDSSDAYRENTALAEEASAGADTLRGAWQRFNNIIDQRLDQSGGEGMVSELRKDLNMLNAMLSSPNATAGLEIMAARMAEGTNGGRASFGLLRKDVEVDMVAMATSVRHHAERLASELGGTFDWISKTVSENYDFLGSETHGTWNYIGQQFRSGSASALDSIATFASGSVSHFKGIYEGAKMWLGENFSSVIDRFQDNLSAAKKFFGFSGSEGAQAGSGRSQGASRSGSPARALQRISAPQQASNTTIDRSIHVASLRVDGSKSPTQTGKAVRRELERMNEGTRRGNTA